MTTAMINLAALHADSEEQIRLHARAQDAKIDLELAEMELQQHQSQHEKSAGQSV